MISIMLLNIINDKFKNAVNKSLKASDLIFLNILLLYLFLFVRTKKRKLDVDLTIINCASETLDEGYYLNKWDKR